MDVAIHPALRQWLRDRSVGFGFLLGKKKAKPMLKMRLIVALQGDCLDFKTRKKESKKIYRLTREGLHVAYPDGALVRKFKCTVCGKVTAGRQGYWNDMFPRKHGKCRGAKLLAEIVKVRVTFEPKQKRKTS